MSTTEDGYKSVKVAVHYFSKWTEARCLKDHKAHTVAQFLFEDIICRDGCVKVQFDTCESAVDARNLETRASSAAYRRGMVGQLSILYN